MEFEAKITYICDDCLLKASCPYIDTCKKGQDSLIKTIKELPTPFSMCAVSCAYYVPVCKRRME